MPWFPVESAKVEHPLIASTNNTGNIHYMMAFLRLPFLHATREFRVQLDVMTLTYRVHYRCLVTAVKSCTRRVLDVWHQFLRFSVDFVGDEYGFCVAKGHGYQREVSAGE